MALVLVAVSVVVTLALLGGQLRSAFDNVAIALGPNG